MLDEDAEYEELSGFYTPKKMLQLIGKNQNMVLFLELKKDLEIANMKQK